MQFLTAKFRHILWKIHQRKWVTIFVSQYRKSAGDLGNAKEADLISHLITRYLAQRLLLPHFSTKESRRAFIFSCTSHDMKIIKKRPKQRQMWLNYSDYSDILTTHTSQKAQNHRNSVVLQLH